MSFRSWLSDLIAPAEAEVKSDIQKLSHTSWTSTNLWLVLAFVALLYFLKTILTDDHVHVLAVLTVVYMVLNTLSKCFFGWLDRKYPPVPPVAPAVPAAPKV